MPEGPTIVYYIQKIKHLEGTTVLEAGGYAEADRSGTTNVKLRKISSHGKNFIFEFDGFFFTVHLGLFGSMLVNEEKKVNASFYLKFREEKINFYVSRVKRYEGKPEDFFDSRTDLLHNDFDEKLIYSEIRRLHQNKLVGDVLMDQNIFAGSGNIIRNEALFRSKIHPESIISAIPAQRLKQLITVTKEYTYEFLSLTGTGKIKKEAKIYGKSTCPEHGTEIKIIHPGKVKRKTYVCTKCQKIYHPK